MTNRATVTPGDYVGPNGTVNRRYALQRIGHGDYLMYSNDLKALWRLYSFRDGKTHGLEGYKGDFTAWAAARWTRDTPPDFTAESYGGAPDSSRESRWWQEVTSYRGTRQEAIDFALRYQPAPFPENPHKPKSIREAVAPMIVKDGAKARKQVTFSRPEGGTA